MPGSSSNGVILPDKWAFDLAGRQIANWFDLLPFTLGLDNFFLVLPERKRIFFRKQDRIAKVMKFSLFCPASLELAISFDSSWYQTCESCRC